MLRVFDPHTIVGRWECTAVSSLLGVLLDILNVEVGRGVEEVRVDTTCARLWRHANDVLVAEWSPPPRQFRILHVHTERDSAAGVSPAVRAALLTCAHRVHVTGVRAC